ncbi:MAG: hypothetical protein ACO1OB_30250, partial [Archangium sp.]
PVAEVDAGVAGGSTTDVVASPKSSTSPHVAQAPLRETPFTDAQTEIMKDVEAAFDTQRYGEVLTLTVKPDVSAVPAAIRFRLMAACALGNVSLVNSLRPRLSTRDVTRARAFCREKEIDLR